MKAMSCAKILGVLLALCVVPCASASCPFGSTSLSVDICSPAGGSKVSSPVQVSASAYDTAHPVVGMKVYVDYNSTPAYSVSNTTQLSASLSLSAGSHHITVAAWDASGESFKNGVDFTVGSSTSSGGTTSGISGVYVSPSNLAFAPTLVGTTSAPMKVTVTNHVKIDNTIFTIAVRASAGQGPFAIAGCSGSASLYGSVAYLYPGQSCTIAVRFTPTITGVVNGSLVLEVWEVFATSARLDLSPLGAQTVGLSGIGVTAPTCTADTVNPSVTICAPLSDTSVSAPFPLQVFTTDSHTVLAMKVYLDGKAVYQVTASQINTTISASAGSHRLTVKAWDSVGAVFGQTINFTVP